MDPQFQELAQHIADDVVKRIDAAVVKRLGEAEQRLGGVIGERLGEAEKGFDELIVKRLGEAEKRLTEQFTGAETRLTEGFTAAETRLSDGAKVHMEGLKSLVKLTAEGYGATLERIERQFVELNTKWDTTIGDHEKALKNHGRRITALERRR